MEKIKYNLDFAKSDGVQIPIQLQLLENNDFFKNFLKLTLLAMPSKFLIKNHLDCSGLLNTLERSEYTQVCLFERLVVDSPSISTSKTVTSDTQSLINQTSNIRASQVKK